MKSMILQQGSNTFPFRGCKLIRIVRMCAHFCPDADIGITLLNGLNNVDKLVEFWTCWVLINPRDQNIGLELCNHLYKWFNHRPLSATTTTTTTTTTIITNRVVSSNVGPMGVHQWETGYTYKRM